MFLLLVITRLWQRIRLIFEITLNENNPPTGEYIKTELDRIDIVIEYSDIFGNAQKPHDTRGKSRF